MPRKIETADTVPAIPTRSSRSLPPTDRIPARWWFALLALALGGGAGGNVVARYTVQDPGTADIREIRADQRRAETERALNAAAIKALSVSLGELKKGQESLSSKVDDTNKSLNRVEGWIYRQTR